MTSDKPILCLDFDGVIHSYTSEWQGPDVVRDPPVPGALQFIERASEHFIVCIFSSRSNQRGGIEAMATWLGDWAMREGLWADPADPPDWIAQLEWSRVKPPATVTIDDRAITFTGTWPDVGDLLAFKPWNK
jgi:hypothetical protein